MTLVPTFYLLRRPRKLPINTLLAMRPHDELLALRHHLDTLEPLSNPLHPRFSCTFPILAREAEVAHSPQGAKCRIDDRDYNGQMTESEKKWTT